MADTVAVAVAVAVADTVAVAVAVAVADTFRLRHLCEGAG